MSYDRFQFKPLNGALTLGLLIGVAVRPSQAQPQHDAGQSTNPPYRRPAKDQVRDLSLSLRDQSLRTRLANAGFKDQAVQQAVVDYARRQEEAILPLRHQQLELNDAVNSHAVADAQLATLLTDFEAAGEELAASRKAAEVALDALIHFTVQPPLNALLTTMGLVGDEMALAWRPSRTPVAVDTTEQAVPGITKQAGGT